MQDTQQLAVAMRDVLIKGRSTAATWNGIPHDLPSAPRKCANNCPRFGIGERLAARWHRPARDIGEGLTSSVKSPGGATDSSAPGSTTASMISVSWSLATSATRGSSRSARHKSANRRAA